MKNCTTIFNEMSSLNPYSRISLFVKILNQLSKLKENIEEEFEYPLISIDIIIWWQLLPFIFGYFSRPEPERMLLKTMECQSFEYYQMYEKKKKVYTEEDWTKCYHHINYNCWTKTQGTTKNAQPLYKWNRTWNTFSTSTSYLNNTTTNKFSFTIQHQIASLCFVSNGMASVFVYLGLCVYLYVYA